MTRDILKTLSLVLAVTAISASARASTSPIVVIHVDRGSLNVTAGDSVHIEVTLARAGKLNLEVIDRDGYRVRMVANGIAAPAGKSLYDWNGRDDAGALVANEAYSLHAVWTGAGERFEYLPANVVADMVQVPVRYYSRQTATVVYDLPVASRVHLQAGTSKRNAKTGRDEGPVMKTVVNREPRAAGRIAEHWTGLDESGSVYVPDLPSFVMAVATTPLPENAIIVTGNATRSFLDQVARRSGASGLHWDGPHAHHQRLEAREDVSPPLKIEPLNAHWSESDRAWLVDDRVLRLRVSVTGPVAQTFAAQPARIYRFADGRLLGDSRVKDGAAAVEIASDELRPDGSLVTLNWLSEYGGVAANTIRVRAAKGSSR